MAAPIDLDVLVAKAVMEDHEYGCRICGWTGNRHDLAQHNNSSMCPECGHLENLSIRFLIDYIRQHYMDN